MAQPCRRSARRHLHPCLRQPLGRHEEHLDPARRADLRGARPRPRNDRPFRASGLVDARVPGRLSDADLACVPRRGAGACVRRRQVAERAADVACGGADVPDREAARVASARGARRRARASHPVDGLYGRADVRERLLPDLHARDARVRPSPRKANRLAAARRNRGDRSRSPDPVGGPRASPGPTDRDGARFPLRSPRGGGKPLRPDRSTRAGPLPLHLDRAPGRRRGHHRRRGGRGSRPDRAARPVRQLGGRVPRDPDASLGCLRGRGHGALRRRDPARPGMHRRVRASPTRRSPQAVTRRRRDLRSDVRPAPSRRGGLVASRWRRRA